MKFLFPLLLATATLIGCSKSPSTAPSASTGSATPPQSPPDPPAEPELTLTFAQICELINDDTYPETERTKLGKMVHNHVVTWEGVLLGEPSVNDFLLAPDRHADAGIIFYPPSDWARYLREKPLFTPVRVTGRLDHGFHGLRLHATALEVLPAK